MRNISNPPAEIPNRNQEKTLRENPKNTERHPRTDIGRNLLREPGEIPIEITDESSKENLYKPLGNIPAEIPVQIRGEALEKSKLKF